MYSNIECEMLIKMYQKYGLLNFIDSKSTNINELTRNEMEKIAFRLFQLLNYRSGNETHLLEVYERKDEILALCREL